MDENSKTWILVRICDGAVSVPYYSEEDAVQTAARQNSKWNAAELWVVLEEETAASTNEVPSS